MVTSYKFIPYSDSRLLQISDVSCNFTIVKTDFLLFSDYLGENCSMNYVNNFIWNELIPSVKSKNNNK